ncbi:hypothetical protein Tco_0117704 [Tanacetum coccineum]
MLAITISKFLVGEVSELFKNVKHETHFIPNLRDEELSALTMFVVVERLVERVVWRKFEEFGKVVVGCDDEVGGTDISKITRKQSKTSKHGHGIRRVQKEAKDSKPKPEKSNPQSSLNEKERAKELRPRSFLNSL